MGYRFLSHEPTPELPFGTFLIRVNNIYLLVMYISTNITDKCVN